VDLEGQDRTEECYCLTQEVGVFSEGRLGSKGKGSLGEFSTAQKYTGLRHLYREAAGVQQELGEEGGGTNEKKGAVKVLLRVAKNVKERLRL